MNRRSLPVAGLTLSLWWAFTAPALGQPDPETDFADSGPPATPAPLRMPVMAGLLGDYPMTRDGSGTSWQPDATPMDGVHRMNGPWMAMAHGALDLVYTDQGGPRGATQSYNDSMVMAAARRSLGDDAVGMHLMGSLEPLNGAAGYPLLFQTGETADGKSPLVDRQHPHTAVMEAALTYEHALGLQRSVFFYGGPVGEPALGPVAFMHRRSSEDDPEAPISHHWMDSTHITFGVVTVGTVWNDWKVEYSRFNGREPDQHRYGLAFRSLDSWSTRVSWNPNRQWALQVSQGFLASPEQLSPSISLKRSTGSAMYTRRFEAWSLDMTASVGHNAPSTGLASTGYLLDAAVHVGERHILFGRYERVGKDDLDVSELAPAGLQIVSKTSVGYVFDFASIDHVRLGLGAVGSVHSIPAALQSIYGDRPTGLTVFLRTRLAH